MEIIDFNDCPYSIKNGVYGGMAGPKDGILYQGAAWLLKYPKFIGDMERVDTSYSTSPLSEYLGSHIYGILEFDVHETILGEKNNKIVVACRDFAVDGSTLLEIKTIKNHANAELAEMLDRTMDETGSAHYVDFDNLMLHLDYNPILKKIPGVQERFWEQAVVDIYINNSDRNNGNWGILRDKNGFDTLAPVFDNGGSFQDKLSEEKIVKLLRNKELVQKNAYNTQTAYAVNGHILSVSKLLDMSENFQGLADAVKRIVPLIVEKQADIKKMIEEIPAFHVSRNKTRLQVCSDARKELFELQLDSRLQNLLIPAYDRCIGMEQDNDHQHEEEGR